MPVFLSFIFNFAPFLINIHFFEFLELTTELKVFDNDLKTNEKIFIVYENNSRISYF